MDHDARINLWRTEFERTNGWEAPHVRYDRGWYRIRGGAFSEDAWRASKMDEAIKRLQSRPDAKAQR